MKSYELTNHLGNVLTTISDNKIGIPSQLNPSLVDHYVAVIKSSNDYFAFGSSMSERSYSNGGYRYGGAGGQEKDDEIFVGAFTAEYWEYDSRLGRRWNVDPMYFSYPHQSPYSVFNNSPLFFNDPYGLEGNGGGGTHEVKSGETMWGIAKENGVDFQKLLDANKDLLDKRGKAENIRPGDKVNIPDSNNNTSDPSNKNPNDGMYDWNLNSVDLPTSESKNNPYTKDGSWTDAISNFVDKYFVLPNVVVYNKTGDGEAPLEFDNSRDAPTFHVDLEFITNFMSYGSKWVGMKSAVKVSTKYKYNGKIGYDTKGKNTVIVNKGKVSTSNGSLKSVPSSNYKAKIGPSNEKATQNGVKNYVSTGKDTTQDSIKLGGGLDVNGNWFERFKVHDDTVDIQRGQVPTK